MAVVDAFRPMCSDVIQAVSNHRTEVVHHGTTENSRKSSTTQRLIIMSPQFRSISILAYLGEIIDSIFSEHVLTLREKLCRYVGSIGIFWVYHIHNVSQRNR